MTTGTSADVELIHVANTAEYLAARRLFEEYAAQLGVDLCFQNFSAELEQLSLMYAPPSGRLILARRGDQFIGCVGVRALAKHPGTCEMKRLYVKDSARGLGLGRRLAEAALEAGRSLGYTRMALDTLATMTAARALYTQLGFRETGAYYANPNPDVKYLERVL